MSHKRRRRVCCNLCGWSNAIPASPDPESAREVARGLAQLHLMDYHRPEDALEEHITFENLEPEE